MHSRLHFIIHAAPLLLVIFIDSIGLGLIIPVLSGLIFNPSSTFLSGNLNTPFMQNLIYGAVLGVFMLCWFFGAVVLGDLSDKIGRKKSLLICLFGAFLSYIFSAISVSMHSISLLLLGRIISGLTSGSQPIAQAAVIDMSHPEQKTRNMSYMYLSLSLGFIMGPLLGGILADNRIVSWFNFATPFYFAALLSLANMLLLYGLFKESFVAKKQKIRIQFFSAVKLFISAFKPGKLKNMSILYIIFIFGWASFFSFCSAFLIKSYEFSPTQVSIYMSLMGVGFCIGNAFLVELTSRWWSNRQIFAYASLGCAVIAFLTIAIHHPFVNWFLVIGIGAFVASSGPTVMSLFSDTVDKDSQGWVMGVMGSIMALVWGINGVVVGALSSWGAALPIYVAALFLLLSALLTPYFIRKN